jgi:hypothetical protein
MEPDRLRIVEIVAGAVVFLLACDVIVNPHVAVDSLRLILGIGLIILGLAFVVRGAMLELPAKYPVELGEDSKAANIILGMTICALGILAIINPHVAIIQIPGIGLIILGLALVARGVASKLLREDGKLASIILGMATCGLAMVAIVAKDLVPLLTAALTIGLGLNVIGQTGYAGCVKKSKLSADKLRYIYDYDPTIPELEPKKLPRWLRGLSFVLGTTALIIAVAVLVFPGIGLGLVVLIGWALLLLAVELIVSGAAI